MGNCTSINYLEKNSQNEDNHTELTNSNIITKNISNITNSTIGAKLSDSICSNNLINLSESKNSLSSNDSNNSEDSDNSNNFSINKITFVEKLSKSNKFKKYFIDYNIFDKYNNIIIGIWNNSNGTISTVSQGIWIGNNEKIYQLIFGIYHQSLKMIILTFENSIKLKVFKDHKTNDIKYELIYNKNEYANLLNDNIIKNYKKINNNSDDIDLIYKFFIDN